MQGYDPRLAELARQPRVELIARLLRVRGMGTLKSQDAIHFAVARMSRDQLMAALLPPRKARR